MSNAVKYLKQPSTHCRAYGTINISKYVNNFLSTKPKTLILSSLVNFDKESKSDFFWGGGRGGVGGGGGGSGSPFLLQILIKIFWHIHIIIEFSGIIIKNLVN